MTSSLNNYSLGTDTIHCVITGKIKIYGGLICIAHVTKQIVLDDFIKQKMIPSVIGFLTCSVTQLCTVSHIYYNRKPLAKHMSNSTNHCSTDDYKSSNIEVKFEQLYISAELSYI